MELAVTRERVAELLKLKVFAVPNVDLLSVDRCILQIKARVLQGHTHANKLDLHKAWIQQVIDAAVEERLQIARLPLPPWRGAAS